MYNTLYTPKRSYLVNTIKYNFKPRARWNGSFGSSGLSGCVSSMYSRMAADSVSTCPSTSNAGTAPTGFLRRYSADFCKFLYAFLHDLWLASLKIICCITNLFTFQQIYTFVLIVDSFVNQRWNTEINNIINKPSNTVTKNVDKFGISPILTRHEHELR